MFRPNTLFVLGAGASCEAKLPSGGELKGIIARMLDITFPDGHRQATGDSRITHYMRAAAKDRPDRDAFNQLLYKAWAIRDGMTLALSIDNYLDAHRGDADLEYLGKLAIAKSILQAESAGSMTPPRGGQSFPIGQLATTWYVRFAQLLTENVPRGEIAEAIARVSVISFNYDRTLEHFLREALMIYYQIPAAAAEGLVSGLRVYRPYGAVGPLPWQNRGNGVAFGDVEHADLSASAAQIRTFGERIEEGEALAAIKAAVEESGTIAFLGFGFHRQNVALLKPRSHEGRSRRIYASALGISASDRGRHRNRTEEGDGQWG